MKICVSKLTNVLFLCIILHHLVTTRVVGIVQYPGNDTDYSALLAVKDGLMGHSTDVLSSWNNSFQHCDWDGITCDTENNRVVALDLNSRGFSGGISPFIGNLSFLNYISLHDNNLVGQLPHELGRLVRLQELHLSNNILDGEIPSNLSGCINLELFNVQNNTFAGKLPSELKALSKLKQLILTHNKFIGPLFEVIGNLTSLEVIFATYNNFTGIIPNNIGEMRNLSLLNLGQNKFSGTLPTSIVNCSKITLLGVGGNKLQGEIPRNIGHKLHNLVALDLSYNQFSGEFPNSILNLTNITFLGLDMNNFSGRVSFDFGKFYNLQYLSICNNTLEGDINFLGTLVNSGLLETLDVGTNHFTGELPKSIANLSTSLQKFIINNNRIGGEIPLGITNLINLTYLDLSNNEFTGTIPRDFGKFQKLVHLSLGSNKLQGVIPDIFENLSRLSDAYLDNNRLEGGIPPSLVNCRSLLNLDLSNNSLNGTLVDVLFKGPSKFIHVLLHNNRLEGFIPFEIGTQINLQVFSVNDNKLSGTIPSSLGDCAALQMLDIHDNLFDGKIPTTFSHLGSLEYVDLSQNNLSGSIPDYFSEFPLQLLNLSHNNFEGEVPTTGVYANTEVIVVDGNNLCGGNPVLHLPKCNSQNKTKVKKIVTHVLELLAIVLCTLVVVVTVSTWLYFTRRGNTKVPIVSSSTKDTLIKVSYDMLLKATNGFSSENLVGVGSFGSVFRGNLDGKTVAIKVLNLKTRGASKSFTAECKALRNIRHRNLVGIITACSSIDFKGNEFKALVYEFMSNGDLDGWLHKNDIKKLSLLQRVDIAIDVAQALNYLHHGCEFPIVHSDLKPTNILLDDDMVARVGDFGLAKILAQPQHPNQSSSIGISGTIGYTAPEYGLGSESSRDGDLYSYGILLLELMTGKRPTSVFFRGDYNIHTYAKAALPDNVMPIVDPSLEDNEISKEIDDIETIKDIAQSQVECIVCVISVGVACSNHLPEDRMAIRDAINKLQVAKDNLCNATLLTTSSSSGQPSQC